MKAIPSLWLLGLPLWLACASATDTAGTGAGPSSTSTAGAAAMAGSGGTAASGGTGGLAGGSGGAAGSGAAGGHAGGAASGGAGGGGNGQGASGGSAGSGGAGGVLDFDVSIFVANTCDVSTNPASITVPTGTSFTVHWINLAASASPADVDKIDQYNQVPIVIGLEPGQSYHDTIREWCGQLYTGIFWFRITGCYDPYLLEVNCGG